ncbi:hypothetical protein Gogos_018617, partial [Gossypium gossypioides]|nr:hypothetical protein [Gossypium gossypioides]
MKGSNRELSKVEGRGIWDPAAIERSRGLITIWDKGMFTTNMEFCGNRFIAIEGKWVCGGMETVLINVYAPNNLEGSKEFGDFINRCKLVDLPLLGKKFTWIGLDNKRNKLDRFLLKEEWLVQLKAYNGKNEEVMLSKLVERVSSTVLVPDVECEKYNV